MIAIILRFPTRYRPIVVSPSDRGWRVEWRSCSWLHATKQGALKDARTIAAVHGGRIVETVPISSRGSA
jgi:hypothetical protein